MREDNYNRSGSIVLRELLDNKKLPNGLFVGHFHYLCSLKRIVLIPQVSHRSAFLFYTKLYEFCLMAKHFDWTNPGQPVYDSAVYPRL
jgi:hypothetical protein